MEHAQIERPASKGVPPVDLALPGNEEKRSAERFALLMRTAKLVCECGEYLCVVRDVSRTGVRVKLFHAMPAQERMALELTNGDFYFIERVWQRDGHAGFRFSAPIDVALFIAESSPWPRRALRLRMELAAIVHAGDSAGIAWIRDLSQHGARIESARRLAVGQRVRLEADHFPALTANVCWRSGQDYGVVFQQGFAFDELARLAAAVQSPLASPGQAGRNSMASPFMQ